MSVDTDQISAAQSGLARYRACLHVPGAAAFYFGAAPGRIGIAMTGVGLLWLVRWSTGSFAVAGLATGGFAIAEAVIGPQSARLIDRLGQLRVLPWLLAAHAASVAGTIGAAAIHAPSWLLVVSAIFGGGSIPQLGALTATRWNHALRGSTLLPSALSLESLSNDVAYAVGPALASIVSVLVHPAVGAVLAATLVLLGGLTLVTQRRTAPAIHAGRDQGEPAHRQRLWTPGFTALLAVTLAIGVYFGAMQVGIAAFAVGHGVSGAAGPLYAISSATSLVAGFVYGSVRWSAPPGTQLRGILVLLALSCLPLVVAGSVGQLALALVLPGLLISPTLIVSAVLLQRLMPPAVLTQALVWQNSASAAGIAAATAVSGSLVDVAGSRAGLAVGAAALTVAAATGVLGRRALGAARPRHRRQVTGKALSSRGRRTRRCCPDNSRSRG